MHGYNNTCQYQLSLWKKFKCWSSWWKPTTIPDCLPDSRLMKTSSSGWEVCEVAKFKWRTGIKVWLWLNVDTNEASGARRDRKLARLILQLYVNLSGDICRTNNILVQQFPCKGKSTTIFIDIGKSPKLPRHLPIGRVFLPIAKVSVAEYSSRVSA